MLSARAVVAVLAVAIGVRASRLNTADTLHDVSVPLLHRLIVGRHHANHNPAAVVISPANDVSVGLHVFGRVRRLDYTLCRSDGAGEDVDGREAA